MRFESYCDACQRLDMESNTCAAFPEGIPNVIRRGSFDHRQPYEGDGGIRFLPVKGREDFHVAG
jgi:hypothetical protein